MPMPCEATAPRRYALTIVATTLLALSFLCTPAIAQDQARADDEATTDVALASIVDEPSMPAVDVEATGESALVAGDSSDAPEVVGASTSDDVVDETASEEYVAATGDDEETASAVTEAAEADTKIDQAEDEQLTDVAADGGETSDPDAAKADTAQRSYSSSQAAAGSQSSTTRSTNAKSTVLRAETAKKPEVNDLVNAGAAYRITPNKGSQLGVTNASKAAKLQNSGDILAGYWQLKAVSGGYYQLKNLLDGTLLSYDAVPSAGSKASLTGVQSSWRLIAKEDGGLALGAVTSTDLFLSVLGGTIAQGAQLGFVTSTEEGAPGFFFVLSNALTEALSLGKSVATGAYAIATALGGSQTLDVQYGSKNNGASLITYKGNGDLAFNQRYQLESAGNNLYTIKALHSGKRVGVRGGSTSAGTAVVQQAASSSLSQLWYLVANGSGYSIRNAKTGYSLEVRGGKAQNVSAIQVGASKGSTAQRFTLRRDTALSESERAGKSVTPGFYLLRSVLNSSVVADIRYASMANGADVIVYKSRSAQNQKLYLSYVGHGLYTIRVAHSGKYLGSAGTKTGSAVRQTSAHNARAQMWYFVKSGSGYALRSAASGLGLALKGKSSIEVSLAKAQNTAAQQFKLAGTQLVADGTYAFGTQQVYGGWLVFETVGRSKAYGANVAAWRTNGGANQKWRVTHMGGGVYRITNANSGMALGIAGASAANHASARQQTWYGWLSQKWVLEIADNGAVAFRNKKSGRYLELAGNATQGADVRQANGNGSKAQGWILRTGKGNVKLFAERMYYYCEKANLGYDQSNRWDIRNGGECDCSSLVVHCLQEAGFDTGQATLTFNYRKELCPRGWKVLPADLSTARVGDILLNDDWHTAAVVRGSGWNALVAQASIDENGWIEGGRGGDQTSRETWTRTMFDYVYGWYCILRYVG